MAPTHCHIPTRTPPAPRRGISHDKQGEYAKAAEDFSAVLALDPGNTNAYYAR